MYLHENADDFRELVAATFEHFGRAVSFIVKDYFAVAMLKELTSADPDLVFKGGTCLSKCYGIIERFSEDVDLGIEEAHATEGMRKRIKAAVVASAGKLGLEIPNIGSCARSFPLPHTKQTMSASRCRCSMREYPTVTPSACLS